MIIYILEITTNEYATMDWVNKVEKGRVYWITGLPGSGKTTIGTALYYRLKDIQDNVLILDGDILKYFVSEAPKYSREDRLIRAKNYSNICKILSDQGMCVIICTVAMFDSIRIWNRQNIGGYVEIFVDASSDVLKERNKNNPSFDFEKDGITVGVELPKDPDYIINTNKTGNVSKFIDEILSIQPRVISDYDRDKDYWNKMYTDGGLPQSPSNFAVFALKNILEHGGGNLLELGCGNGRDSLFFMENGIKVTAVDASNEAISLLQEKTRGADIVFVCDDFVKCKALFQVLYDSIYSRFTLHSITEKQEDELLNNVKNGLKHGGRLYIEARTTRDDIFGKGKRISDNEYEYNGHYRRFIDKDKFINKLRALGFNILYVKEDRGFSKTDNSDPVLLRLIADYN